MINRFWCILFGWALGLSTQAMAAPNEEIKIGVVLLHGKQGYTPRDQTLTQLVNAMNSAGMMVVTPEMAWSARRLMDRNWMQAVDEIKSHIDVLKRCLLSSQTFLFEFAGFIH